MTFYHKELAVPGAFCYDVCHIDKEVDIDIILLLLVFLALFLRVGHAFVVPLGFTWLAAAAFNPPINSNFVWFIGCLVAYMFSAYNDIE